MLYLSHVYKQYRNIEVLHDVTLDFTASGVYVLQGGNGSGKSTILKILSGLIYKTGGKVERTGGISYLPDKFLLPKLMRVKRYIQLILSLTKQKGNVADIMEKFQLPNKRIGELSKGNLQKLAIFQIFSMEAEYYILDEPLDGLDDFAKKLLKQLISEKVSYGKVVIFSSPVKTVWNDLKPRIFELKEGIIHEKKKRM